MPDVGPVKTNVARFALERCLDSDKTWSAAPNAEEAGRARPATEQNCRRRCGELLPPAPDTDVPRSPQRGAPTMDISGRALWGGSGQVARPKMQLPTTAGAHTPRAGPGGRRPSAGVGSHGAKPLPSSVAERRQRSANRVYPRLRRRMRPLPWRSSSLDFFVLLQMFQYRWHSGQDGAGGDRHTSKRPPECAAEEARCGPARRIARHTSSAAGAARFRTPPW